MEHRVYLHFWVKSNPKRKKEDRKREEKMPLIVNTMLYLQRPRAPHLLCSPRLLTMSAGTMVDCDRTNIIAQENLPHSNILCLV